MVTAESTCVDCGSGYQYDAQFYQDRALKPPKRCPRCRSARRQQREPAERIDGAVVFFDSDRGFGFVWANAMKFYFTHYSVRAEDLPLLPGDRVSFERDPFSSDERPRASVVRRIQETS